MKKYLIWSALLLLLSITVNLAHEHYANRSAEDARNQSCFVFLDCSPDGYKHAPDTKSDAEVWWERGYVFFGWPNGASIWALILTLVAVGEQSFHTARAAKATEDSVEHARVASQIELRAYLVVTIGTGSFQDKTRNIKFEGAPNLTNTGQTPAMKVRYTTNAQILDDPLDASVELPEGKNKVGEYVIGPQQPIRMSSIVEDFVGEYEVGAIRDADKGKALFYWGRIVYEDAFGKEHYTDFCHRLHFYPDPDKDNNWKVGGHYIAGRNNAT